MRPVVREHTRILRKTDGWRFHLGPPQLFGDEHRSARLRSLHHSHARSPQRFFWEGRDLDRRRRFGRSRALCAGGKLVCCGHARICRKIDSSFVGYCAEQFWNCDKNTAVAILLHWHDVGSYLHRLAVRQIVPVKDVPAATVFDTVPNLRIFSWSKFRR